MKIQSLKTVLVLLLLFFSAPFVSKAQEFPPENALSTPMDPWLIVIIGVGALYGLIRMCRNSQPKIDINTKSQN